MFEDTTGLIISRK